MSLEYCDICDEPTGQAGRYDDSLVCIYCNRIICSNCQDTSFEEDIVCKECEQKMRSAAYEDVGLQPHRIDSIIGQLLGYLDAEQAELLIELPCMIGDTVYQINYDRTIENYKVIGFEIDERGQLYVRVLIERPAATLKLSYRKEDLYFSREEAEKALKEMEGKQ